MQQSISAEQRDYKRLGKRSFLKKKSEILLRRGLNGHLM